MYDVLIEDTSFYKKTVVVEPGYRYVLYQFPWHEGDLYASLSYLQ